MYRYLINLLFIFIFSACSTTAPLGNTPIPPGKVGKIVGNSTALTHTPLLLGNSAMQESPVSIMSFTSGIITVWAIAPNNWLWGYSPFDSKNFGSLRNWYIIKNPNGSVSFRNVQTETCIASHGNGIVHTHCNTTDLTQQFDLLPLTNSAIALKNAANQQCLRTPLFRSTVYMSLTFASCVTEEQNTLEQQWFIIPPILNPFPIPYQGDS
ncbi:hypothetical protein L4F91_09005 [Avibacterium sp. 20-126]|uniref:hypothetical protein n=1 Tax=Avibacterium sp. 20-126 TaxID=2911524 RepID=UPI00218A250D|nr:hypothetical protein L4F91_09005 [Avibacterium sp. 20-126]